MRKGLYVYLTSGFKADAYYEGGTINLYLKLPSDSVGGVQESLLYM